MSASEELSDMLDAKQMLISSMYIYMFKHVGIASRGHCIAFRQPKHYCATSTKRSGYHTEKESRKEHGKEGKDVGKTNREGNAHKTSSVVMKNCFTAEVPCTILQPKQYCLTQEENLAGVNPLPVGCPILLVDAREINSDLNSVVEAAQEGNRNRSENNNVRTLGEASASSVTEVARENNRTPEMGNGMDTGAGLNTGNHIVVNLSKRELSEAEISLLSKGLKFCPTPEKVDVYNLRKDIREFVRQIRLREFFYCDDEVDGAFSDIPTFRNRSAWCPEKNREMAVEAYVEALENAILSHDFETSHQRNLTREEQRALENLQSYDDIIIKQADKGSAVVVLDKGTYVQEAMRQLNDEEVYTSLDTDPTQEMVGRINDKIKECYVKGGIEEKTKDYLLVTEDAKSYQSYISRGVQADQ
ncbi:hypothetical protein ACROYT_G014536 [Oculina patagonica]